MDFVNIGWICQLLLEQEKQYPHHPFNFQTLSILILKNIFLDERIENVTTNNWQLEKFQETMGQLSVFVSDDLSVAVYVQLLRSLRKVKIQERTQLFRELQMSLRRTSRGSICPCLNFQSKIFEKIFAEFGDDVDMVGIIFEQRLMDNFCYWLESFVDWNDLVERVPARMSRICEIILMKIELHKYLEIIESSGCLVESPSQELGIFGELLIQKSFLNLLANHLALKALGDAKWNAHIQKIPTLEQSIDDEISLSDKIRILLTVAKHVELNVADLHRELDKGNSKVVPELFPFTHIYTNKRAQFSDLEQLPSLLRFAKSLFFAANHKVSQSEVEDWEVKDFLMVYSSRVSEKLYKNLQAKFRWNNSRLVSFIPLKHKTSCPGLYQKAKELVQVQNGLLAGFSLSEHQRIDLIDTQEAFSDPFSLDKHTHLWRVMSLDKTSFIVLDRFAIEDILFNTLERFPTIDPEGYPLISFSQQSRQQDVIITQEERTPKSDEEFSFYPEENQTPLESIDEDDSQIVNKEQIVQEVPINWQDRTQSDPILSENDSMWNDLRHLSSC